MEYLSKEHLSIVGFQLAKDLCIEEKRKAKKNMGEEYYMINLSIRLYLDAFMKIIFCEQIAEKSMQMELSIEIN